MIPEGLDQMIIHLSHFHPLTLYDYKASNDKICCKASNQECSGPAYGCNRCKYYLHESCSKMTSPITHPSHPQHPLSIPSMFEESSSPPCNSCEKQCGLFAYCCFTCSFALDVNCFLIMSNTKYENHEHLLTLIEEGCSEDLCKSCNKICKGLYLRCVECSFNLHVQCHPSVPHTINHHCHIDPLTLANLHDLDQLDPDEEFYCDACET
ncbi:uncharacterized protein LOC110811430 [Carica papaya]|uniref:uncharacterized protein LOC110811430 n=1 Tax=Carica papaya TaxID=3649 RepID=UPI000B8CBDC7|nr:uncharacterized protein LOC110811430 [Carica papaya]